MMPFFMERMLELKISEDMLNRAKAVDLVSYLSSIGYTLQKAGNCYKLKISHKFSGDLSSLTIFPDGKGWKRWSDGSSGHDTISFMQKVQGKTFQDAVRELCGGTVTASAVSAVAQQTAAEKHLVLPEVTDGKYSRVFAYLTQTRGISAEIVSALMKSKQIYQDKSGNVVFVGMDAAGTPKYGAFRGTVQGKQFRGECSGSDKRYGFRMDGTCEDTVLVFEAPIDAMSHATLVNQISGKPDAWKVHTRLALGGTADAALEHYLQEHPKCRKVTLCLDNDEAGIAAAKLTAQKLASKGYIVKILPPKCKDYNEQLMAYAAQNTETKAIKR